MKKILFTSAMLTGILTLAQETKKDSANVKTIESVSMTKKLFQKKADRLVYDVAATTSTKGSTAYDLMKEIPSVTNTDDKEFKILGKSAVQIFINGRKSNLDQEAVNALLKGTPSENISKIEVISVPGSEYDVAGNTGIINIILKKKTTDGVNGTLRMQNEKSYFDNPSASITVNFRKNKFGGNANAGLGQEHYYEGITLENGNASSKTISRGSVTGPNENYYAGALLDYEPDAKNYFSIGINTVMNPTRNAKHEFYNQTFGSNAPSAQTLMLGTENRKNKTISTELHYDRSQDDKGSKLKLNGGYLFYKKNEENMNRIYEMPARDFLSGFNQTTPQVIRNYSFQADEILKLRDGATLSFGGNFNFTKTDNNTLFETSSNGISVKDNTLSNHFVYRESIGAVYANYERNLGKKISAKGGVRYEYSDTKGDILGKDDPLYHFKKNYGDILPFLNLNYNINDINSLSYNFSSRVKRPSFWELNPVRNYTTSTNFIQNNPFMAPSKIYSQELMYMFKNAYFLTIGHTITKDASTQIPLQKINAANDVELRYIRTNYGDKQDFSATVGLQKAFFKNVWIGSYTATLNHSVYKGSVNTDPLTHEVFDTYTVDRKSTFFIFSGSNQIAADKRKTWWFGADYFIVTPQNMELGKLPTIQQLNLSLKKNWENWTFKAAIDDILNTNHLIKILNSNDNGYFSNVYQNRINKTYSLSITYNFGNSKIKNVRREESANQAIKSRTGGK